MAVIDFVINEIDPCLDLRLAVFSPSSEALYTSSSVSPNGDLIEVLSSIASPRKYMRKFVKVQNDI